MVTSKGQPLASLFQSNLLQFNSAGQQETPQQQSQIEVLSSHLSLSTKEDTPELKKR